MMWILDRKRRFIHILTMISLVLVSIAVMQATRIESQSVLAPVKRELPIYKVQTTEKKLSISFDAAWGTSYTEEILDILDRYNIKTTFFLVGFWVEANPEQVKEIARRGHEIGNHSENHPHMTEISAENLKQELLDCNNRIEQLTGVTPKVFRPPFGDYDNNVITATRELGLEPIQWSVDSLDWKDLSANEIYRRVIEKAGPGDIVLFHNNSLHIAEALPSILDKLIQDGYKIVPVTELLLGGNTVIDNTGMQKAVE